MAQLSIGEHQRLFYVLRAVLRLLQESGNIGGQAPVPVFLKGISSQARSSVSNDSQDDLFRMYKYMIGGFALVGFDNGSPCDKGTLSEMEEIMKLAIKKEINLIKNERRKRQNARLLHASQNPQRYCRVIL